jgi:hypothetical protein
MGCRQQTEKESEKQFGNSNKSKNLIQKGFDIVGYAFDGDSYHDILHREFETHGDANPTNFLIPADSSTCPFLLHLFVLTFSIF